MTVSATLSSSRIRPSRMCSVPTYSWWSRAASSRAQASDFRTRSVKLYPFIGRLRKALSTRTSCRSQIRAALVDLPAVGANQLALAPFQPGRTAVVARRQRSAVVRRRVTRRGRLGGRTFEGDGRFRFAHASNQPDTPLPVQGFPGRLTPPGLPRHISVPSHSTHELLMTSGQIGQPPQTSQSDHGSHPTGSHGFDLHAAARRILLANGFEPDYEGPAKQQLDGLTKPASAPAGVRDLRDRPWSSIDNTESKDLDQIEVAESMDNGNDSPRRRHRRRRRARDEGLAARRARVRELHVGVHGRRRLPDAAGQAVDRSHVAQRERGPAGDRDRDGGERATATSCRTTCTARWCATRRSSRTSRSAHGSTAATRRPRSPTTRRSSTS